MHLRIKHITTLLASVMAVTTLSAQQVIPPSIKGDSSFAVITDSVTFARCRAAIDDYKQTIESEGLPVFVAAAQWSSPDQVKAMLEKLYRENALEGCVLVGDVPIAMVTKAQHLTSAFKMDERKNPLRNCSVPSDRFYDDFDLKFVSRGVPSDGLLHYYVMAADSPQYIACDIYSARIKAQKSNGDPYEQISKYLKKAVAQHKSGNKFDRFVSYTGHGSYSNSLPAWRSEQQITDEQFGDRFKQGNTAKYLRYSMEPYMKYNVIRELRRPDLDFMVFHEHGDFFRQYLSGEVETSDDNERIQEIKAYLHSLYRRTPDEARAAAEKQGLDSTWYANANDPEVVAADSLLDLKLGIINEEINDIRPNARMVIFDACYNGDFRNDDYIAGKYIFSDGDCTVAWANSVNVLQDKSAFDLLGLLGHGMRIGLWAKNINILESHITGDPTFFFASDDAAELDINKMALSRDCNMWKQQLDSTIPDLQCLALIRLYENDCEGISDLLLKKFIESPYAVVRHTAFRLSESLDDANFKKVLTASVNDSFEFIRRIGVTRIGRTGDDDFIPLLVNAYIDDSNSARILFQTAHALGCFDREKVRAAIEKRFEGADFYNAPAYKAKLLVALDPETAENGQPMAQFNITNKAATDRARSLYIPFLKNKPLNQFVPSFIEILQDPTQSDYVRTLMAESLAWFNLSIHKAEIAAACRELLDKGGMSEELTTEVQRAYSRLTSKK